MMDTGNQSPWKKTVMLEKNL